jgi:hypothetical protein
VDKIENIQLHLTEHAHEQYCERVEYTEYEQLYIICNNHLKQAGYIGKKEAYIQLDGTWWCYDIVGNLVTFITCYGHSSIDLPRALKWAECNNDKINLIGSVAVEAYLARPVLAGNGRRKNKR